MHFFIFVFALTLMLILSSVKAGDTYLIDFDLQGVEIPYSSAVFPSRPDSYCVASLKTSPSGGWNNIGQTESNSGSNPIWQQIFNIDFQKGEYKGLKVDARQKGNGQDIYRGGFEVDVGDLAAASNYQAHRDWKKDNYYIFPERSSHIILRHRIYKVNSRSACGDHSPSFPYILVALSLYYFLRH